jgi:hypothetical protein
MATQKRWKPTLILISWMFECILFAEIHNGIIGCSTHTTYGLCVGGTGPKLVWHLFK